jgi:hypothetical protein
VQDHIEPRLGAEQLEQKRRAFRHAPEGLPGVLVWSVDEP